MQSVSLDALLNDAQTSSPASEYQQFSSTGSGSKPQSFLQRFKHTIGYSVCALIIMILVIAVVSRDDSAPPPPDNSSVAEVALFAFNDVYEIVPVGGYGGLARVKTYKSQLEKEFPDGLITILPGDFYSPSALGVAPLEEDGVKTTYSGKQMVAVLNKVGVDVATYGNHEFDLKQADFLKRVKESKFPYVATNVLSNAGDTAGQPLPNTVSDMFITRKNIRFAFVGIVIDVNKGSGNYVDIKDLASSITQVKDKIKTWRQKNIKWDVLVALTHVNLEDDIKIAEQIPEIDLILGGHEHQNWYVKRGTFDHPIVIAKADANAKTVFTHRIHYDRSKIVDKSGFGTAALNPGVFEVASELHPIDGSLSEDPTVLTEVTWWWDQAAASFKKTLDIDINKQMCTLTVRLDARDSITRRTPFHPFGDFFTGALHDALVADINKAALRTAVAGDAQDVAVAAPGAYPTPLFFMFHGGSVRIDDILEPGPLTEYDVLRIIPYSGEFILVEAKGKDIEAALLYGRSRPGAGAYPMLHSKQMNCGASNSDPCLYMNPDTKQFTAFDPETTYVFGTSDYIARGGDHLFPTGESSIKELYVASIPQTTALKTAFQTQFPVKAELQRLRARIPSVFYNV